MQTVFIAIPCNRNQPKCGFVNTKNMIEIMAVIYAGYSLWVKYDAYFSSLSEGCL
jgi:hypothetical protein